MDMDKGYDIAIVGGGIVGCIIARCFALCGQKVVIIEAEKSKAFGGVDIPISIRCANKDFLTDIGLWNGAESVIQRLHLSAAGHFGVIKIEEERPLAQVVSAKKWLDYVKESILREDKSTRVVDGRVMGCHQDKESISLEIEGQKPIQARRVVIADGAKSPLSEYLGAEVKRCVKAFRSVIFYVKADHFTEQCAWIRQKGAVIYGVIPHKDNQGWVIATMPLRAKRQIKEGDDALAEDLQRALGTHLGSISHLEMLTKRDGVLQSRDISVQSGVISMGNASLQMPPIGAQGLNVAIENCKVLYQLQKRQQWHETCPDIWQMQFAGLCQPRQDRWYALMDRVMLQLAEGGALALLKEKMAWGLLGIDSQFQAGLAAMGKGCR